MRMPIAGVPPGPGRVYQGAPPPPWLRCWSLFFNYKGIMHKTIAPLYLLYNLLGGSSMTIRDLLRICIELFLLN
jgi:hypothetical protein